VNKVNRYGDCPSQFLQQFDCTLLVQHPSKDSWYFDSPTLPDELEYEPFKNALEKVMLSAIEMPTTDTWIPCQW
jgi:hypothetical protein